MLRQLPGALKEQSRLAEEAAKRRREEEYRQYQAKLADERRMQQVQVLSDEAEGRRRYLNLLQYVDHLDQQARLYGDGITSKFKEGMAELRALAERLDPTRPRIEYLNANRFLPPDRWG